MWWESTHFDYLRCTNAKHYWNWCTINKITAKIEWISFGVYKDLGLFLIYCETTTVTPPRHPYCVVWSLQPAFANSLWIHYIFTGLQTRGINLLLNQQCQSTEELLLDYILCNYWLMMMAPFVVLTVVKKSFVISYYYYYLQFCLTGLFSRDHSRSGRIHEGLLKKDLWGLPRQGFYRPDALPITQPTVSEQ